MCGAHPDDSGEQLILLDDYTLRRLYSLNEVFKNDGLIFYEEWVLNHGVKIEIEL
jgi:hypothetical protein